MRHYPRARSRFSLFRARRRCACGLRYPCPDARLRVLDGAPLPDGETHVRPSAPEWTGPTALLAQVGRAGRLTPAQAERAAGGR